MLHYITSVAGEEVFQVSWSTDVSFVSSRPLSKHNFFFSPNNQSGCSFSYSSVPSLYMCNEWGKRLVKISLQSVLYVLRHCTQRSEWNCMVSPSLIFLRFGILDFWKVCCNTSHCCNTRGFCVQLYNTPNMLICSGWEDWWILNISTGN